MKNFVVKYWLVILRLDLNESIAWRFQLIGKSTLDPCQIQFGTTRTPVLVLEWHWLIVEQRHDSWHRSPIHLFNDPIDKSYISVVFVVVVLMLVVVTVLPEPAPIMERGRFGDTIRTHEWAWLLVLLTTNTWLVSATISTQGRWGLVTRTTGPWQWTVTQYIGTLNAIWQRTFAFDLNESCGNRMTIISIRINFEIPSYSHPARFDGSPAPSQSYNTYKDRVSSQPPTAWQCRHGDGIRVAASLVAVVFESDESVVAAVIVVVASADAVVACAICSLCSP